MRQLSAIILCSNLLFASVAYGAWPYAERIVFLPVGTRLTATNVQGALAELDTNWLKKQSYGDITLDFYDENATTTVYIVNTGGGQVANLNVEGVLIVTHVVTDSLLLSDDAWIGLGPSAGRFVFDDLTIDKIRVKDGCLVLEKDSLYYTNEVGDFYLTSVIQADPGNVGTILRIAAGWSGDSNGAHAPKGPDLKLFGGIGGIGYDGYDGGDAGDAVISPGFPGGASGGGSPGNEGLIYITDTSGVKDTWLKRTDVGYLESKRFIAEMIIGAQTNELHSANAVFQASREATCEFSSLCAHGLSAIYPAFSLLRTKGSLASPAAVSTGNIVGVFKFRGYDGSALQDSAYLKAVVDGSVSANTVPMKLIMQTSPNKVTGLEDRLVVRADGTVEIPADNAKLKFGTGKDAAVYYDGTDLCVNPQEVGTGNFKVLAGEEVLEDGVEAFKETTGAPGDVTDYGKHWTEADNQFHFMDGDGNEHIAVLSDQPRLLFELGGCSDVKYDGSNNWGYDADYSYSANEACWYAEMVNLTTPDFVTVARKRFWKTPTVETIWVEVRCATDVQPDVATPAYCKVRICDVEDEVTPDASGFTDINRDYCDENASAPPRTGYYSGWDDFTIDVSSLVDGVRYYAEVQLKPALGSGPSVDQVNLYQLIAWGYAEF